MKVNDVVQVNPGVPGDFACQFGIVRAVTGDEVDVMFVLPTVIVRRPVDEKHDAVGGLARLARFTPDMLAVIGPAKWIPFREAPVGELEPGKPS